MNDSALDLQEQVQQRLAESGAASTSGRDASQSSGSDRYLGHRCIIITHLKTMPSSSQSLFG